MLLCCKKNPVELLIDLNTLFLKWLTSRKD